MSLNQAIVRAVQNAWPDVQAIYLFGSFASGDDYAGSDLDVAVVGPAREPMPVRLSSVLSTSTNKVVDLVDLRTAPTVLQKEVISAGHRLWEASFFESEMFDLYIYASYQKLQEERAEIINDGIETGRFYGR